MKTKHFRDLQIWQKAMALARQTYAATTNFPKSEVFGLTGQMRRSAISVPSNIAEGHGRTSDSAFALFLGHARGSLCELETQIILSMDLGYLNPSKGKQLVEDCEEIARMLNAFLNTLNKEKSSKA